MLAALVLSAGLALALPPQPSGQLTTPPKPAVDPSALVLTVPEALGAQHNPDNAALLYYRYWLVLSPETTKRFLELHESKEGWAADPEMIKLLEDNQGVIAGLVRATSIPECRWGHEWGLGWSLLMPQYSQLRTTARLIHADILRLIAKHAGSAEIAPRVAGMMNLSRHAAADPTMIGSLVSAAICGKAMEDVKAALDAHALDSAGRDQVLAAARRLREGDVFSARQAIQNEGVITAEWVRQIVADRAQLDAMIQLDAQAPQTQRDAIAKLKTMPQGEFFAEVDRLTKSYTEILAAWDQPDALKRLDAIEVRVARGEFGVLANFLAPAVHKAKTMTLDSAAKLDQTISALEGYTPPAAK